MNLSRIALAAVILCGLLTPLSAQEKTPADLVDVFIGTSNSRWMLGPYACVPFGMVQLGPDNQTGGWMSGYEYSISNVTGFSHLHAWTMGGLMIMPATQDLTLSDGAADRPYRGANAGYHSRVLKETEQASPGYYSVELYDASVRAEMTATTRTGFLRFTPRENREFRVLLDLAFPSEYHFKVEEARIARVSDRQIEGHARCRVWGAFDYTLHFVVRFNKPFTSFNAWNEKDVKRNATEASGGGDTGAWVTFPGRIDDPLLVQTGLSLVDLNGARKNLRTELEPFQWDFDAVTRAARDRWNDLLGRIRVEGGTEKDRIKFYTNLYRCYCAKQTWNDVDGRYTDPAETIRHLPEGCSIYGGDAFWNTYWNLNGVWSLISPNIMNNWVVTELELFKHTGWTSNGPTGVELTGIMEVSHEIALMVAAYQKGIRNYDVNRMYEAVLHTVTEQGRHLGPVSGPAGNRRLDVYKKLGYVPSDQAPVCRTLDYAYDDFCVAQLAKALGKTEQSEALMARSANWKNIFHPERKLVVPRDSSGRWQLELGPFSGRHLVEGNAWQYSWYVPHDIPGLVRFMGRDLFNRRLEEGFTKSAPHRFAAHAFDRGQTKAIEYYVNHGNEVNMQAAYLFNYSGKPWLTQKYARAVMEAYYGCTPYHGWEGDEDEGQMGGWFVMSALGLFEMDGGVTPDPMVDLGSPLFERIVVTLDPSFYPGKTFTIIARDNSKKNVFIQSAVLNGEPLKSPRLRFHDVVGGGELVLTMGPEPNRSLWKR